MRSRLMSLSLWVVPHSKCFKSWKLVGSRHAEGSPHSHPTQFEDVTRGDKTWPWQDVTSSTHCSSRVFPGTNPYGWTKFMIEQAGSSEVSSVSTELDLELVGAGKKVLSTFGQTKTQRYCSTKLGMPGLPAT